MHLNKSGSLVLFAVILLGASLPGCAAEPLDGETGDPAAEEEAEVGAAEQALDAACNPYGNGGGGTWGDILMLCRTSEGVLYVQKRDGSAFTSSGDMHLVEISRGFIDQRHVNAGDWLVPFGQRPHGQYRAFYYSDAPGWVRTGWLEI